MKSLEQFLSDYLGKSKGYPDGQYVGECLSSVKLYIKECFGINPPASGTNSAYGYWSNFPSPLGTVFEKIENNPDLIPQKGWIVIWKPWTGNQYGHIAIIKDGNLNTFNSYDQNWGTKVLKEINHNYDNVVGFLKPKQSIIEDMTEEQKRILDFLTGKTEGDVRQAFGCLEDMPNKNKEIETLSKDIETLKANIETLNSKYAELKAKFIENQKLAKDYQTQLTTANEEINKLNETISNITEEKNTWQTRYNNKNSQFNSELEIKANDIIANKSISDLIKLLINKIFKK